MQYAKRGRRKLKSDAKKCGKWVHGKCGGIKGSLALMEKTFRCERCCDGDDEHTTEGWGQDRVKQGENGKLVCELGNGEQLEVVSNFCYLGDTIEQGEG